MSDPLPVYNPWVPYQLQDSDYDCSQESCQFMLRAWGRSPDDAWMTQEWISQGIMTPQYGLMDATGAGMARWLNDTYTEDGYLASNNASVSFDDIAAEVAPLKHPAAAGGRTFCHWVGIRAYTRDTDLLQICNSAPGYMGVGQTLSRAQFGSLGPWSMVRLTHPAAEAGPPALDYSPWEGMIGPGLLEMMQQDKTLPAQRWSTWLPLSAPPPADIEEAVGQNGVGYRWLLKTNRGYRFQPS